MGSAPNATAANTKGQCAGVAWEPALILIDVDGFHYAKTAEFSEFATLAV